KLVAGSGRRLNSQNLNPARPTISTAIQANSPPRKYSVAEQYFDLEDSGYGIKPTSAMFIHHT
ncbi:hypothetical protein AB7204_20140, partial [Providencia alcalifaciens]